VSLLPRDEELVIEAYRGFHDFPRCIIARASDGSRWLLDCPFDDDLDDYRPDFSVFVLPADMGQDVAFSRLLNGDLESSQSIATPQLVFDVTGRSSSVVLSD
jgi:hypothetical protein